MRRRRDGLSRPWRRVPPHFSVHSWRIGVSPDSERRARRHRVAAPRPIGLVAHPRAFVPRPIEGVGRPPPHVAHLADTLAMDRRGIRRPIDRVSEHRPMVRGHVGRVRGHRTNVVHHRGGQARRRARVPPPRAHVAPPTNGGHGSWRPRRTAASTTCAAPSAARASSRSSAATPTRSGWPRTRPCCCASATSLPLRESCRSGMTPRRSEMPIL